MEKRFIVSPADFGAVGDGVTDNFEYFRAALDHLAELGGGTLTFPPTYQVYAFSAPLNIPSAVTIKGAGDLTTILKYTGSTRAALTTDVDAYNGIRLEDFHIDLSTNTNAVSGIDCRHGLMRGKFTNVRVTTNAANLHGIVVRGENPDSAGAANQGQFTNIFDNCIVKPLSGLHSGYGLYLFGADINDARVNNNVVIGGIYEGTSGGIYINGAGNTIIGADIEESPVGIVFAGDQTYKNTISGCYFDQPAVTTPIKLLASATQASIFCAYSSPGLNGPSNVSDLLGGGRQRYTLISDDTIYTKSVQADNVPKAWVLFTGSTGAIQKAFNVSAVTRNGAGDYTCSFTTALASANIGITGSVKYNTGGAYPGLFLTVHNSAGSFDASACRIDTIDNTNTPQDANTVFVQFYCFNP